jgi:hypothetical protein
MQAVNVIFVPVPVPIVGNGVGWERRAKPHPYPRHSPVNWSPREAIPAPLTDLRQARDLIAQGKRIAAERRASKLLRELNGG